MRLAKRILMHKPARCFALSCRNFSPLPNATTFVETNLPPVQTQGQGLKSVSKPDVWSDSKFRLVPFVKEDLRNVLEEVPPVQYYFIGDNEPAPYPYKDIPLTEPISIDENRFTSSFKPDKRLRLSRLENGLKIASIDKGGYLTNLGLFVKAGSRHETEDFFGCSRFIEHMAFQATAHLSWLRTIKTLETLGVAAGCSAGRDQLVYHAEVERRYVPIVLPLLTGNVIFPRFLSWDVERRSKEFIEEVQKFNSNPDQQITEALHSTAWFNNTLGNRLAPSEKDRKNYNPQKLREFMMKHFSPDQMVLVGVNYDHDELSKWSMRAFVDYEAIPPSEKIEEPAKYTGGEARLANDNPSCHIAVGFETPGGWNGEHIAPITVLQTILGGGGAFSTGGPGKGMYTRLYLEESCVAFSSQYADSGLFGLYMKGHNAIGLLRDQFNKMGNVTQEELKRAKNSLKSSIWINLEMRGIVMEDIAKQLLMSGKYLSGEELCAMVDKVTAADIKRAVQAITQTPPTVVAYGDIAKVPRYNDLVSIISPTSIAN